MLQRLIDSRPVSNSRHLSHDTYTPATQSTITDHVLGGVQGQLVAAPRHFEAPPAGTAALQNQLMERDRIIADEETYDTGIYREFAECDGTRTLTASVSPPVTPETIWGSITTDQYKWEYRPASC